ncbi:MAG: hypothetical protein ACRC17_06330 [Culicoidibacterales bacterium]
MKETLVDVLSYEMIIEVYDLAQIIKNLIESLEIKTVAEFAFLTNNSYQSSKRILIEKRTCGANVFERTCESLGYNALDVLKKGGKMK